MAIKPLAELDDFSLVNSGQDCRGWTVMDASGARVGTVKEMLVDTDRELVTALVLDNGQQVPARAVSLKDGTVIVRGMEAQATPSAAAAGGAQAQGEVTLPVIEEEIRIGKREVERGGVRVSSHVTERPVEQTVTLREEQVNVERRPVDRAVTQADAAAMKEGTFEVTTMAEEAVVAKQARVVGEVVVSKDATERQETVRDTVRRTDVDVEQLDTNTKTKGKGSDR